MSSALYLTTKAGLHFTSQRRPDLQHTTHSKQPAAVLSSKIPNCKLGSDIKHKVAVSIPSDSIIIPLVKFGIRGRICITLTQCWWGRAGLHTRVYVCNGMYPDTHPHTHTHTSRTRALTHARTHARTHRHTHTLCRIFPALRPLPFEEPCSFFSPVFLPPLWLLVKYFCGWKRNLHLHIPPWCDVMCGCILVHWLSNCKVWIKKSLTRIFSINAHFKFMKWFKSLFAFDLK